jgi:hypothetical protein
VAAEVEHLLPARALLVRGAGAQGRQEQRGMLEQQILVVVEAELLVMALLAETVVLVS